MSTTAAASGSKTFVQFTSNGSPTSASNASAGPGQGGFLAGGSFPSAAGQATYTVGSGIHGAGGSIAAVVGGVGGSGSSSSSAGAGSIAGGGGGGGIVVSGIVSGSSSGSNHVITASSGHAGNREVVHHQHQQMNQNLPILKPDLLLNDTGLFTVYCFIKNFIGASGTSAVAIDNKIEQAMDLVKSHLMIAVREEVEVLKEKIAELMDRINQLELENTILKANVSQETLTQLSATMQTATSKPPQNTNTSNGPVS